MQTGLGACGFTNNNGEKIVALAHALFDRFTPASGNPNQNSLCGKRIQANLNGKSVVVKVVDRCVDVADQD